MLSVYADINLIMLLGIPVISLIDMKKPRIHIEHASPKVVYQCKMLSPLGCFSNRPSNNERLMLTTINNNR